MDMSEIIKYETEQGEITLSTNIIKRYLVSGNADKVTDQEVMMFLALCKYQKLNPFLREAYLIKFGDAPASIVTGKDVFTKRASASQACKGWEAGIIVKTKQGDIQQRNGTFVAPDEVLVGGFARIYRQGWQVPLEITVSLSEYQRTNSKGELMRNWREMPATMIRKVALVQALREAMPQEFQGMYSPEEMPVDISVLSAEPVKILPQSETADFQKQQSNKQQKPAQKQPTTAQNVITKEEREELIALAGNDKIVKGIIIDVMTKYGYKSSSEIKISDYKIIYEESAKEIDAYKMQQDVDNTPLPWEQQEAAE